ncbi:uncharacterized protein ARMOST_14038 [Armillaria ostoyae]|uniref:Uncharacterized protein n=1 Tax=Armillaria ostoyae TaxID=47428 RepID=A0A284RPG7_ARMOS|nr:uncharacterized protein ARMOST_14038 [Armillaria ostoyae]
MARSLLTLNKYFPMPSTRNSSLETTSSTTSLESRASKKVMDKHFEDWDLSMEDHWVGPVPLDQFLSTLPPVETTPLLDNYFKTKFSIPHECSIKGDMGLRLLQVTTHVATITSNYESGLRTSTHGTEYNNCDLYTYR